MTTQRRYTDPATGQDVRDCDHCVDGYQPLGLHPILGALFRYCRSCVEPCDTCGYRSYRAEGCCGIHLADRLWIEHRFTATVCPTCTDLIDVHDRIGRSILR